MALSGNYPRNTNLVPHPYYPPTINLPLYAANKSSTDAITIKFGVLWLAVCILAMFIIGRVRPSASQSDKLAFVWMCLTGCIHFFFEAYFVISHKTLAGSQHLFAQLWKEYSLSDSRYLTSDVFLISMEAITAFCWGPLAFYIAYSITIHHPARYALQLMISLGQIYGDVLYYATSLLDVSYCRPERYYFWMYYFFFNFIWIIIPCYYAKQSIIEISGAFRRLEHIDSKSRKIQ